ncbi:MAG: hypothetical protein IID40_07395 [Planctomycetes bacterium]|nr:hypothetical protein [Planctomycetota bacterium]
MDADALGLNDGSSWEDAYNGLQDALDHTAQTAQRPIEIRIAQGTYRPSRRTDPEARAPESWAQNSDACGSRA